MIDELKRQRIKGIVFQETYAEPSFRKRVLTALAAALAMLVVYFVVD